MGSFQRIVSISPSSANFDLTLNGLLEEFVGRKSVSAHPDGSGYCFCGSEAPDLQIAKCLQVREVETGEPPSTATGPDHRFSTDETCAGCPHNGQLRENQSYWERETMIAGELAQRGSALHVREAGLRRELFCIQQLDRYFPDHRADKGVAK